MRGSLVPVGALSPADRHEMSALLMRFFAGVDPNGFAADLADKDFALLLRDASGSLKGFTTLALAPIPGRRGEWVLHSGDTIVDASDRHSAALAASWIGAVSQLRHSHQIERLLWLLICSSVRTYRFLPLFFCDFAPHPERETRADVAEELRHLARLRYGERFCAENGVVVLERPQLLRPEFAARPLRHDTLSTFFADHNPGADRGDELVCLCLIDESNLTAAGRRMAAIGALRMPSPHS